MSSNLQNCSFEDIGNKIRNSSRVLILSHVRPDGDAIGSQIALGSSLEEIGKEVILMNEDGCPSNLAFLKGSDEVIRPTGDKIEVDLCLVLDTANYERIGLGCASIVEGIENVINIDHHITNEMYGDLYYVDPSSPATAQIIFEFLSDQKLPINPTSRDAVFIGLSTDTGGFRYPATTARSFEIGADLLKLGADCGELSSMVYERYSFKRIELLRELLGNLKITSNGKVASWVLSMEIKNRLSLRPEDSENLTDLIRGIDTVQVAVFFEELKSQDIRISMRSKNVNFADVSKICGNFGGGGHPLAAGAKVEGDIINVDVTAIKDGWHGDTSRMFYVGDVSVKAKKLTEVTYNSMMNANEALLPPFATENSHYVTQQWVEIIYK